MGAADQIVRILMSAAVSQVNIRATLQFIAGAIQTLFDVADHDLRLRFPLFEQGSLKPSDNPGCLFPVSARMRKDPIALLWISPDQFPALQLCQRGSYRGATHLKLTAQHPFARKPLSADKPRQFLLQDADDPGHQGFPLDPLSHHDAHFRTGCNSPWAPSGPSAGSRNGSGCLFDVSF